jgi:predicted nucleic acid-binding protein
MANSVFLDTNGWLALLNSADNLHAQANGRWREIVYERSEIVLTDWVVAETGNGLARFREKGRLAAALDRILQSSRRELVIVDEPLLRRALEYFGSHQDKAWGLVDCASFFVMQERGITEAFTSDHDFEQAGFRCLLNV